MLLPLAVIVMAYVLGSFSGSLILGRYVGVDIRQHGSGNAGGTNAFRTRGWRFALGVALIDVFKGVLAAGLPLFLTLSAKEQLIVQAACVLSATAGHVWPVFFGFRGGKGAATLVGGLAVMWPSALPWVLLAWVSVLVVTGYVGLSTILATAVLVPLAILKEGSDPGTYTGFAVAAAWFIAFTHRANLQRLRAGNEHRFNRVRIFARNGK